MGEIYGKLISEWDKHFATIAMLPFRNDIWRNDGIHARDVVLQAVKQIAKHEQVLLCVDLMRLASCGENLPSIPNVEIVDIPYDDIWARDISPSFVQAKGGLKGVSWGFNAWGGLYYPFNRDAKFAIEIAKKLNCELKKAGLVFEGGAFSYNGHGVFATVEKVLFDRNPRFTKKQAETKLKQLLGIEKVIWLKEGLYYDETGGHIDNFMSFVNEREILLSWTDDKNNIQYQRLIDAYNILIKQKTVDGRDFIIHKIPLPEITPILEEEASGLLANKNAKPRLAGDILLPTYSNAYIFNGGVILPVYGSKYDDEAIKIYRDLYADRTIYPINSRELLIGGGSFHCIFHEIPTEVL